MKTLDKDEQGQYTPFLMTAYKATVQRNFELSFASEGDPATVTLTFDLAEDKNKNILDFVELDVNEDAEGYTPSADYSYLNYTIKKARGLTSTAYTQESWTALQTAVTAGVTALESNYDATHQEDIDDLASDILSAIDALADAEQNAG